MSDCWLIKIGGYEATVSAEGKIVECHERLNKLKYLSLKEVFNKYKNQVRFEQVEKIPYPLILGEDKFNVLAKKNPDLLFLKEKFNCDVY